MILRFFFVLALFFGWASKSKAQLVNPRIWYMGYQAPEKKDTTSLDTGILKDWGASILDFRQSPFKMTRNGYVLNMFACNAQIYDIKDSLILYTNGSKIFNGKHRLIQGGDSLSYGRDWVFSPYSGSYYAEYLIGVYQTASMILPRVAHPNQYYVVSMFVSQDTLIHYKLVYTLVDMSLNNGLGKVLEKEKVIKYGNFTPAVSACKHGNGKDWWLIVREYDRKNFSTIVLDSSGFRLHSEDQLSNWSLDERNAFKTNIANKFSWDGSKFVSFTYKGIELYDFNRCTGKLSNRKEIILPPNDTFPSTSGGCFSPNDQFIYTSNVGYLYQIEVKNAKLRQIAAWDRYEDTATGGSFGWPTGFGAPQLAPDGKIYFATSANTRYLHTIEKPNDTGILSGFKKRNIRLLTWNVGLPHFPNYELGAVADQCAESGIANGIIEEVEIYPNPAQDYVQIRISEVPKHSIDIVVTDVLGRTVWKEKVENFNSNTHSISTKDWTEGIYFLRLFRDQETLYYKQVQIQR